MSYASKEMKRDKRGMIVPQVWNPALDNGAGDWEVLTGSDGAYKAQGVQFVVEDSFEGSGSLTKEFDEEMHGIVIANDHTADLTLTIHGKSRTVKGGEGYEGYFKPFTTATITASGPWRAEALQQYGVASAVVTLPPVDTTAPENVTGLDYNAVTQSSVELVWNASVAADTDGYEVWRGGSLITTVTGTSYTATSLNASTQYTFTIKAKDKTGNVSSGTSINVTTAAQPIDTTPPDNVTGLEATKVTETGLTLTWQASGSSDLKDYRVYQGQTLIATVTGLSHAVSGLTAGTAYTFTVKARDTANNEASGASVEVTTDTAPPADTTPPAEVTNLAATPAETTVNLTWTASVSGDVTGYNVYNGDTKLNGALITGAAYTVSGLTAATAYTFTVKAVDGNSNESAGVNVSTTTTTPATPEGLTSITNGLIHSFDFSTGSGSQNTIDDLTGDLQLALQAFTHDGTNGWIGGGLKSNNLGWIKAASLAAFGMSSGTAAAPSGFTVIVKSSRTGSNTNGRWFSSADDNDDIHLDADQTKIRGRFMLATRFNGALNIHPTLRFRNTSANAEYVVDNPNTVPTTLVADTPSVIAMTADNASNTMSLYHNGALQKAAVTEVPGKFDGVVIPSGHQTTYALLIYNRALSAAEIQTISNELLA